MSKPEMDRFVNDVKKSSEMQEKMKSFTNHPNGAIAYAQSLGYDVTLEDGSSSSGALSDDDLDQVAGGSCEPGCGTESALDGL